MSWSSDDSCSVVLVLDWYPFLFVVNTGGWLATWLNYVSVAVTSTAFIPTTYGSVNDISLDSPSVLTMMNQPKPKPQHCVRKHTVHMLNTSNIQKADNQL